MMKSSDNGNQRLELRKYPNRRYYDATRSRHVTLEEIHALIRDGNEITVTDSKTGEDLTAKVLAQIILELDPPKLNIFPVPLLHRLIRANEELVRDFIDKYFNQALLTFLDSQHQYEQYLRQILQLQSAQPMLSDWPKMMLNPFVGAGGARSRATRARASRGRGGGRMICAGRSRIYAARWPRCRKPSPAARKRRSKPEREARPAWFLIPAAARSSENSFDQSAPYYLPGAQLDGEQGRLGSPCAKPAVQ